MAGLTVKWRMKNVLSDVRRGEATNVTVTGPPMAKCHVPASMLPVLGLHLRHGPRDTESRVCRAFQGPDRRVSAFATGRKEANKENEGRVTICIQKCMCTWNSDSDLPRARTRTAPSPYLSISALGVCSCCVRERAIRRRAGLRWEIVRGPSRPAAVFVQYTVRSYSRAALCIYWTCICPGRTQLNAADRRCSNCKSRKLRYGRKASGEDVVFRAQELYDDMTRQI